MDASNWISLVAVGVALLLGLANYFHVRMTHRGGQIKDRLAKIEAALTEFYSPLIGYLNVSQALFKIFIAGKPKEFRTLTYLLDPGQLYETGSGLARVELTESDRAVLKEILRIGRKIEELITRKSGYVEDRELLFEYIPNPSFTDIDPEVVRGQGLLAIAVTHIRLIRMAFRGTIKDQVERYRAFVYPRELNQRISGKIESLRAERDWLASLDPTSLNPDWSLNYDPAGALARAGATATR
jgi:hypothetical protein